MHNKGARIAPRPCLWLVLPLPVMSNSLYDEIDYKEVGKHDPNDDRNRAAHFTSRVKPSVLMAPPRLN